MTEAENTASALKAAGFSAVDFTVKRGIMEKVAAIVAERERLKGENARLKNEIAQAERTEAELRGIIAALRNK